MRPRILAGWMLAWFAGATPWLAGAAPPAGGQPKASMAVTSDRMEMDDINQVAVFTGHVVADDGKMRLTADRMTVRYNKKIKGQGGLREVKAEGKVTIQQERDRSTADVAIYQVDKRTVELIGNDRDAVVLRGDDQLTGRRILVTLDGQQRISRVAVQGGGENQRVSARITPTGVVKQNESAGRDTPRESKPAPSATEGGSASGQPLSLTREKITVPAPNQPLAPASPAGTRDGAGNETREALRPASTGAKESSGQESRESQRLVAPSLPESVEGRSSGNRGEGNGSASSDERSDLQSDGSTLPTPKPKRRAIQPLPGRR
ncbi:MAG: hypothetical protein H7834_08820 [Magnetococcus sp. YQC-9]